MVDVTAAYFYLSIFNESVRPERLPPAIAAGDRQIENAMAGHHDVHEHFDQTLLVSLLQTLLVCPSDGQRHGDTCRLARALLLMQLSSARLQDGATDLKYL